MSHIVYFIFIFLLIATWAGIALIDDFTIKMVLIGVAVVLFIVFILLLQRSKNKKR